MAFARAVLFAMLLTLGATDKVDQLVCTDTGCSQNCNLNEFPLNTCIQASAGGSMMFLQCDSTGVIYNLYNSQDCSGTGDRREDGVGTCLTASSGSFINTCKSGGAQNNNTASQMARCSTCLPTELGTTKSTKSSLSLRRATSQVV